MTVGVLAQRDYKRNGLQTFESNLVPWLLEKEGFEPIYYRVDSKKALGRTFETFKLRNKISERAEEFDRVFVPAQNRLRFDPTKHDTEFVTYVHDIIPYTARYHGSRNRMIKPFMRALHNKLNLEYLPHLSRTGIAISASHTTDEDLNCRTAFSGDSKTVYQGVDNRPEDRFEDVDRDIDALYVGELFDRKNPEMVRNVMQRLKRKGFNVASVNFEDRGLPGKSFEDLTEEDLARIYSRSRFIIHFSKMEGFGRTPVEAQRYGCIPLALDNSINREILGEPLYSWVDVESVDDVINVVEEGVKPEMRENARENSSQYKWKNCRKQVKQVLEDGI